VPTTNSIVLQTLKPTNALNRRQLFTFSLRSPSAGGLNELVNCFDEKFIHHSSRLMLMSGSLRLRSADRLLPPQSQCGWQRRSDRRRLQSCSVEGINRVRANQLINIHNIAVARVLGAGAGPQQPLDICTFCRQSFPAISLIISLLLVSDFALAIATFPSQTEALPLGQYHQRPSEVCINLLINVVTIHRSCYRRNAADVVT